MNKIILVVAIALSLNTYAQRDTTVTDSTPLVTLRQVDHMLYLVREKIKDKVTIKEFEELTQQVNAIVNEAYLNYQRRKKIKKDGN